MILATFRFERIVGYTENKETVLCNVFYRIVLVRVKRMLIVVIVDIKTFIL